MSADALLDAKEVARQLGVSRKTVYALVHRGDLPEPLRIGNRSRWRQEDVDRLKKGPRKLRRPRRGGGAA